MEFPELFVIPLDKWIDALVDWLTVEGDFLFDALGGFLLKPMLGIEKFLLWLPWFVFIIVVALIAWRLSSWKLAAGVIVGLIFIGSLGLWEDAMKTLSIVFAATGLAILTGVPDGNLDCAKQQITECCAPFPGFDANNAQFCIPDPGADVLWSGEGARVDRGLYLCCSSGDPSNGLGDSPGGCQYGGSSESFWGNQVANSYKCTTAACLADSDDGH